jgi:hypothetical protein
MLAVSLRRRGAAWLQQVAPAARGLLLGSSASSGRALTASAERLSKGAVDAVAANIVAELTTPPKRGRPFGSTKAAVEAAKQAAKAAASSGSGKKPPGRKPRSKIADPSQRPGNDAASTVLLVESPAKAKKIQEFLGSDYTVCARVYATLSLIREVTVPVHVWAARLTRWLLPCRCWQAMDTFAAFLPSQARWHHSKVRQHPAACNAGQQATLGAHGRACSAARLCCHHGHRLPACRACLQTF